MLKLHKSYTDGWLGQRTTNRRITESCPHVTRTKYAPCGRLEMSNVGLHCPLQLMVCFDISLPVRSEMVISTDPELYCGTLSKSSVVNSLAGLGTRGAENAVLSVPVSPMFAV